MKKKIEEGPKYSTRMCTMPTPDDWFPCYEGGLVKVRLSLYIPYGRDKKFHRVCVWGADDFGMEKDFESHEYEEARALYLKLTKMSHISKNILGNLGFTFA